MTKKIAEGIAYIKKNAYLCSEFKTPKYMTDQTVSSYQGFGHRVQLIRRNAVAREWAVVDNRRVIHSTTSETVSKDMFLNHVAGIVRQLEIQL